MPVGELFLGAILQVLFDRLASRELLDFADREGLHSRIVGWGKRLQMIQDVLQDAENKQTKNSALRSWLKDLRDLAYDVEDLLDEFDTEALRRKLMADPQATTSKVQSFIPTCLNPSIILFRYQMSSKIKEIDGRFRNILEQKDHFGLEKILQRLTEVPSRPHTTSCVFDPRIYGRAEDIRKLKQSILTDNGSGEKVGVIPIVGMGGIGKTTLARHVFNDETVYGHFHEKAWVCVSDNYDIKRITKAILESFTSQSSSLNELNELQTKVNETLTEKKFLLVLDDVWNTDYVDWDNLRSPFGSGKQGSKIIVTTRNHNVVSTMAPMRSHFSLNHLSDDDCWLVFKQHAFEAGDMEEACPPNLISIGRKIVEKCKGLPLAAKSLGGLLRNKLNVREYEDVLNSEIWDLSEEGSNGIVPALKLSYYHLPAYLKPCFEYCSIFPKDYEFEEREVVFLWIAQGYISGEQMEDVGNQYFRELSSRLFFQPSSGDGSLFVMHDLIHNLARNIAEGDEKSEINKVRHFSYTSEEYDVKKKFEDLDEAKCLRTFLRCYPPSQHFYFKTYITWK
ncbi:putative disease resistance RPP13-like protein 1 isoform X4 [Malania oleifera]|uniref:putative disease resistance RPP13-like protein 1 isoform X4 n=1 Tax=Malania oleifera TaxID=397392 RepID=UPI0025ADD097|nr:putative disease resistance RPP13-like protein 1 isoform X4 [Malania oleifera]